MLQLACADAQEQTLKQDVEFLRIGVDTLLFLVLFLPLKKNFDPSPLRPPNKNL